MIADRIKTFDDLCELVTWGLEDGSKAVYMKRLRVWRKYANDNDIDAINPTIADVSAFLSSAKKDGERLRLKNLLAQAFTEWSKVTQDSDLLAKAKAIKAL